MRKVLYKKWIPIKRSEGGLRVKDTGKYEEEFSHEGLFHQWGIGYEEFESGPGNFSYAIVENSDGTIEQVLPSNLKFIS